MCIQLKNFMGAPAPSAPMLPTPVYYGTVVCMAWTPYSCAEYSARLYTGQLNAVILDNYVYH